jgi:catalase
MLQGRLFSYADAHRWRLDVNYTQLPVNRPHAASVQNYYRDSYEVCMIFALSAGDLTLHYVYFLGVKSRVTTICRRTWVRDAKAAARAERDERKRSTKEGGGLRTDEGLLNYSARFVTSSGTSLVDIPPGTASPSI